MNSVKRIEILNNIGNFFQGVIQWRESITSDGEANVVKHLHYAEALIQLLEVEDCGSVGGFDKNQPTPKTLFDRWDWLFHKYDNPKGKRFGCGIVSYGDIRKFFRRKG